jgi:hypothetical protein
VSCEHRALKISRRVLKIHWKHFQNAQYDLQRFAATVKYSTSIGRKGNRLAPFRRLIVCPDVRKFPKHKTGTEPKNGGISVVKRIGAAWISPVLHHIPTTTTGTQPVFTADREKRERERERERERDRALHTVLPRSMQLTQMFSSALAYRDRQN